MKRRLAVLSALLLASACSSERTGLSHDVHRHVGQVLLVSTIYGWGWADATPESRDTPAGFEIRLERLWEFGGELRGGVGRVITSEHEFTGRWVVFSTRHAQAYDFTDKIGYYNIAIGRREPVANDSGWPLFPEGSLDVMQGFAEIRLADARPAAADTNELARGAPTHE